jgi:uracil-DNA glycosylase
MSNNSWDIILEKEFNKRYFNEIINNLREEYKKYTIYPDKKNLFKAFDFDYNKLKVVIIGQDPYHSINYTSEGKEIPTMHGLAFSTLGTNTPPSLLNIFKELKQEYIDFEIPKTNNLVKWKDQGILLLNMVLSVRKGEAASHSNKIGWEHFTQNIIKEISRDKNNIVFMLWGKHAKKIKDYINNEENHLILESSHPSPFSYHISFKGNNHFIKANNYLNKYKKMPINWQL